MIAFSYDGYNSGAPQEDSDEEIYGRAPKRARSISPGSWTPLYKVEPPSSCSFISVCVYGLFTPLSISTSIAIVSHQYEDGLSRLYPHQSSLTGPCPSGLRGGREVGIFEMLCGRWVLTPFLRR